jgi:hypothetical protein
MSISKKKAVDIVIVIPVAPSCNLDYLQDTIDSIIFYTKLSYAIIVIENSDSKMESTFSAKYPFIKILETIKNDGTLGDLYITLSIAYKFALDNYDFKVLLKMDTDALMIGDAPEIDAINYFEKNPNVGLLGSYKVDCNGNIRFSNMRFYTYPKNRIIYDSSWINFFLNKRLCILLRMILKKALNNGYEYGDHCLGAAYFISRSCLQTLNEQNLLQREEFRKSKLGEDHIFSLLVRSIDFEIGDFTSGDFPICVRHRGLPCSPDELIKRKKKLTHSTRFWGNMNEQQIRKYFREIRISNN